MFTSIKNLTEMISKSDNFQVSHIFTMDMAGQYSGEIKKCLRNIFHKPEYIVKCQRLIMIYPFTR